MISRSRLSRDYAFQIMTTFGLIAVLLAATAASASQANTQKPCTSDDNCKNFTFFLGPRWGTKTLQLPVPNQPDEGVEKTIENVGRPEEGVEKIIDFNFSPNEGVGKTMDSDERPEEPSWSEENSSQELDLVPHYSRPLFPRHRPVPDDESLTVDFMDVEQSQFRFGPQVNTNAPPESPQWMAIEDVYKMIVSGALNLTGFGLTGDQVKQALYNLSSNSRTRLQSLNLSRNQIRSLPVLCFTLEMEYELRDLSLADNPLGSLDSYTRFELSRLNSLKTLSLARTGLRYLESLYIPSLESLDLSGNSINNYPYPMLSGLLSLQSLNMSHNRLRSGLHISDNSLSKLSVLDLSDNWLTGLDGLPFYQMNSLKELNLKNNALKFSYVIGSVPYGVSMQLAGNPWECSCPLTRMVNHGWQRIVDKESMRCTNEHIRVPWPVTSLLETDPAVDCPLRGPRGWLKDAELKFRGVFRDHRFLMSPLLWWALLFGAVMTVVCVLRRHRRMSAATPLTVPYNILDDKHVI